MSIITISRGSYSHGKEVAEKLAEKLNYDCVSRDILLEASETFNIDEIKLTRAIHDAPSILDRFTYGKERFIAYIRAALLEHMRKDNIVYHGLAGHFFLQNISHALKVRIVADMEDRIQEEMKREKISLKEAEQMIKKDDDERRKWSLFLYGKDTWDPSLYDMILHVRTITADQAVDIIFCAAQMPCFQTNPQSQRNIDNLVVAAKVKAAIVEEFPTAEVAASDGDVFIEVKSPLQYEKKVSDKITDAVQKIPEVKNINVSLFPVIIEE